VEPTPEGNIMYEGCRRIVDMHDGMMERLSSVRSQEEVLKIGATDIIYSERFSKNIVNFHESNPNIQMEFVSLGYYDCERYLENDIVDLCITMKLDSLAKYKFKRVWTDLFHLYTDKANPLASKTKVRIKDLANEKIILLSNNTKGGSMLREYFIDKGFIANIILSTSQMSLAFEYVTAQMGVAILPFYGTPQEYCRRKDVVSIEIQDLDCFCEMGILYLKDKMLSRQESDFISYFADTVNCWDDL